MEITNQTESIGNEYHKYTHVHWSEIPVSLHGSETFNKVRFVLIQLRVILNLQFQLQSTLHNLF